MNKYHKFIISLLFTISFAVSYFLDINLNSTITQNLVTFFTVTFGFYMTCLAVLFTSRFTKKIYQEVDPLRPHMRKIHTLKKYFSISSYWAITTIMLLIIFDIKDEDKKLILSSILIGASSVNILFITFFLNTILNTMVEEAKQ